MLSLCVLYINLLLSYYFIALLIWPMPPTFLANALTVDFRFPRRWWTFTWAKAGRDAHVSSNNRTAERPDCFFKVHDFLLSANFREEFLLRGWCIYDLLWSDIILPFGFCQAPSLLCWCRTVSTYSVDLSKEKILPAAGRSDLNFVHVAVKASVHCFLLTFERSKGEEMSSPSHCLQPDPCCSSQ